VIACLSTLHEIYPSELSKEDLEQIGVDRLSDKSENKATSALVSGNEASTTNKDEEKTSKDKQKTNEDKQKTSETAKTEIPDWERELQEELQVGGYQNKEIYVKWKFRSFRRFLSDGKMV
jgi:hypothetical protein